MACRKYQLTNTGTTDFYFNYKRCSDSMWQYEVQLNPGQTKTIVFEDGTYQSPFVNNLGASVTDLGAFPPSGTTPTPNLNSVIDNKNKSMVLVTQMPNSTNWFYSVLNYGTATILEPVDTGLDYNTYYGQDRYTITDKGYALHFWSSTDLNLIFLDYSGNIVGTYSATTNNWNNYIVQNFMIFIDYDNDKFIYSDGTKMKIVDVSDIPNYDLYYNGDYASSDSFIISSYDGIFNSYYFVNMNGIKPLYSWNGDTMWNYLIEYQNKNFLVLAVYDDNAGRYFYVNIYSSINGELLHTININGEGDFDNLDYLSHGTNQVTLIFRNNDDYLIYNYDGNKDILASTTHERSNYGNYDLLLHDKYDFDDYNSDYASENIAIVFYNNSPGYTNGMYEVSYCDIVTYFDTNSDFSTYTYQTEGSATKNIWLDYYDYYIGQTFIFFVSTNQSDVQLLTITPTGGTISNSITPISVLNTTYFYPENIGEYFFFYTTFSGDNNGFAYIYSSDGTLSSTVPWSNYIDYIEPGYNTLMLYLYDSIYYFNGANKSFELLNDGYYYTDTPSYYDNNQQHGTGNMLLQRNSPSFAFKVLTPNKLSNLVTPIFPSNSDNWRIGKDIVAYVTFNDSNFVVVALYDLNMKLLKTYVTNETSYDYLYVLENRFYLRTDSTNNTFKHYLITNNSVKNIITSDNYISFLANDYFNWWD